MDEAERFETLTEAQMELELARKRLSDREARYAEIIAYCGYNRAAMEGAGFDPNTGTNLGKELWSREPVQRYIRLLGEQIPEDVLISSRRERMQFLSRIIRGEETEEVMTKMGVVTTKVAIRDQLQAVALLSRIRGDLEPDKSHESERTILIDLPANIQKIFASMPDPKLNEDVYESDED